LAKNWRKRAWTAARVGVTLALVGYVLTLIEWRDSLRLATIGDKPTIVRGVARTAEGAPTGSRPIELVADGKSYPIPPPPTNTAEPDPYAPGFIKLVLQVDRRLLILAILSLPLSYLLLAIRWQWLLRTHDIDPGFWETLRLSWVGLVANNVLPSSIGGDAVKAVCIVRRTPSKRVAAVMTVLMDRALGLVALLAVGGGALATQALQPELAAMRQRMLIALAVLVVGMFVFFSGRVRALLRVQQLIARLPHAGKFQELDSAIFHYRKHPWMMVGAVAMSVCLHVWTITCIVMMGAALGMKSAAIYYYMFVPIIFTMGAFVPSVAGLGVMEGAFAGFFSLPFVGDRASAAVALCLLYRVVQILLSLPGLLWLHDGLAFTRKTEAEPAIEPKEETTNARELNRPALSRSSA
jgi:glycosyltransferase 2 family protein